jgi:hypothetical protein
MHCQRGTRLDGVETLSADEIFAVAGSVSLTEIFGPKGVTGEMQTRDRASLLQ